MTVVAMLIDTGTFDSSAALDLARRLGLTLHDLRHFETGLAQLSDFGDGNVPLLSQGRTGGRSPWNPSPSQLAARVQEEVLRRAAEGDALIVGWAAPALLRPVDAVACVRVYAPDRFRERNVMRELAYRAPGIAQIEIDSRDALMWRFVRRMAQADPADPGLYHLVLNAATFSVCECANLVRLIVRQPRHQWNSAAREMLDARIERLNAIEQSLPAAPIDNREPSIPPQPKSRTRH